jgi:hypothetical protein
MSPSDQIDSTPMPPTVAVVISKPVVPAREQLMMFRRTHRSEVIELACDPAELEAEMRLCEAISAGAIHVGMTFAPNEVRLCDLKYPHTAGPAADAQDADGNRHASSFIRSKLRRNI